MNQPDPNHDQTIDQHCNSLNERQQQLYKGMMVALIASTLRHVGDEDDAYAVALATAYYSGSATASAPPEVAAKLRAHFEAAAAGALGTPDGSVVEHPDRSLS